MAATFQNKTGYLTTVQGSLQREFSLYRNYKLDASTPEHDYSVTLSTNGDVYDQAYRPAVSAISFTIVGPSEGAGMTVEIPKALGSGFSVYIDGKEVRSSNTAAGLLNRLSFDVPPGKSSVTIALSSPSSATSTATSTSETSSSTSTSPVTSSTGISASSSSQSSTANTTGGNESQNLGQLQLIGAAAVVLVVGASVGLLIRKKSRSGRR